MGKSFVVLRSTFFSLRFFNVINASIEPRALLPLPSSLSKIWTSCGNFLQHFLCQSFGLHPTEAIYFRAFKHALCQQIFYLSSGLYPQSLIELPTAGD